MKTNTVWSYLNVEFKNKNQAHRYRDQIDGCQRWGSGVGKIGEGGQKVQAFSYKISHGDGKYSMVTIVNTILHTRKSLRANIKSPYHKKNKLVTVYGDEF